MKEALLIIDDDFDLVNLLKETPPSAEAEIIHTFDDRGGSKVIARQKVSTVVLNLMLPDTSGFSFLEDLRVNRPMPILATGSATAEDRVMAYLLGADLFMQKPIDPMELVLNDRRRSALQRRQPVMFSPKEFDTLYFLASNPGIVFSQETIYARVWKAELPFGSRCVTGHVSSIRQKLSQQPGDESYIETVYGVGYRFASSP